MPLCVICEEASMNRSRIGSQYENAYKEHSAVSVR